MTYPLRHGFAALLNGVGHYLAQVHVDILQLLGTKRGNQLEKVTSTLEDSKDDLCTLPGSTAAE